MRSFTITSIKTSSNKNVPFSQNSRIHGRIPSQAARKAFTQYTKTNKRIQTLFITLRETTADSTKQIYQYEVKRQKLKNPIVRFKGTEKEFKIRYRTRVKSSKNKKTMAVTKRKQTKKVQTNKTEMIGGMKIEDEDGTVHDTEKSNSSIKLDKMISPFGWPENLLLIIFLKIESYLGTHPLWEGNLIPNALNETYNLPKDSVAALKRIVDNIYDYCSVRKTKCIPGAFAVFNDPLFHTKLLEDVFLEIELHLYEHIGPEYVERVKDLSARLLQKLIFQININIGDDTYISDKNELLAIVPPPNRPKYLAIVPPPSRPTLLSFYENFEEMFNSIKSGTEDLFRVLSLQEKAFTEREDIEEIIVEGVRDMITQKVRRFKRNYKQTEEIGKLWNSLLLLCFSVWAIIRMSLFISHSMRKQKKKESKSKTNL